MRVLVVTDSERVRALFERLELSGELQLLAVADLARSDSGIADFRPGYAFVQSRMSGLSAEIVLRHLKKLLPHETRIVILAVDADDAARAGKLGIASLELAADDDDLTRGIADVVHGARPGKKKGGKARRPAPAKGDARGAEDVAALAGPGAGGPATPAEPVAPLDSAQLDPVRAEQPSAKQDAGEAGAVDAASPVVQASFEEIMRRAAEKGGVTAPPAENGDSPGSTPASPPDPIPAPKVSFQRRWLVPLVLALVLVPLLYHLLNKPIVQKTGQRTPPQGRETRLPQPAATAVPSTAANGSPAPTSARPASRQTAPPAQQPAGKAAPNPATIPPGAPAARQAPAAASPHVGAQVQPSESGVRNLPPFLAGVRPDPFYAKAHPGWQRYPGARAEYKLFREGGLYKAIQVIALTGQTVPDEIFRKVLSEFAGSESYRVQSTELKDRYLIEHCTGRGNAAITIYRRSNDRKMKGLVVYYK